MSDPVLAVENITKRFPGVTALRGVNLSVDRGEVLALIGENGAGKSTLMKILAGIEQPDEGTVSWCGQPHPIRGIQDAMRLGIALIHQELNLADNLDIGANIFLGREPRRAGLIDRREIRRRSAELLKRVGLDLSPDTIVSRLPIGQRQLVEIAKALSIDARVIIMDEPTSSLSSRETERLLEVVGELKRQDVSVIYISHRLGEVKHLADRVLVFRDGENSGELQRSEITHDRMVQLMVGRDVSNHFHRTPHQRGPVVLATRDLVTQTYPQQSVNFEVHAGEIVGMAGLVGAGRTELLRVLFGVDRQLSGDLLIDDTACRFQSPHDAIAAGLALVPEDRKQEGIVLPWSVEANCSLPGLARHSRAHTLIDFKAETQTAEEVISDLRVKTPSRRQITEFLSGGNQQKVVLGKWLQLGPKVLLLDEPTRGIDIGAKEEIYQLMDRFAAKGLAVLFVSSEMEEIIGISDRVLVMHEGRIAGELTRDELTEESIMTLATGRSLTPTNSST